MTVEQRLEQVEQQNQKIQRTNKRLTVALTMTVVAMCAVVTVAAKDDKISTFDTVAARKVFLLNDANEIIVIMGATDSGAGLIKTMSKGKDLVSLHAAGGGYGKISTYEPNGKELVSLPSNDNGGVAYVFNKTGESIAQMRADEYGNGVVGAYNRKGKGRTLQPAP